MEVGITELVKHVTKLVGRAEHGEEIVITRHGRPVAKLTRAELPRGKVKFGTMKGKIKLLPGWDEPLPLDMFDAYKGTPEAEAEKKARRRKKAPAS